MTIGIRRIGKNNVAAFIQQLGFFQVVDLYFTADVFGALTPFQLDTFDAEFFDCIFLDAQTRVFNVRLHDDGAIAVTLMVLVKLHAAFQVDSINHAAVLDHRIRVHTDHVFADGQSGARQRGADGQPFPVVLGDIGGADTGDDPGKAEFDLLIVAE